MKQTESQTTRTEIESLIDDVAARIALAAEHELPGLATRCRELADEAEALADRLGGTGR